MEISFGVQNILYSLILQSIKFIFYAIKLFLKLVYCSTSYFFLPLSMCKCVLGVY